MEAAAVTSQSTNVTQQTTLCPVPAKPYTAMAVPVPPYRWCFVPGCKNTTIKTPEKSYLSVPKDEKKRQLWCRVPHRDQLVGGARRVGRQALRVGKLSFSVHAIPFHHTTLPTEVAHFHSTQSCLLIC